MLKAFFDRQRIARLMRKSEDGGAAGRQALLDLAREPVSDAIIGFLVQAGQSGIDALGTIADPRASRALLRHFDYNRVDTDFAVAALSHPRHACVVPDLLRIALTSDTHALAWKAVKVLERIGTPEAIDALEVFHDAPERKLREMYVIEDTGESAVNLRSTKEIEPGSAVLGRRLERVRGTRK